MMSLPLCMLKENLMLAAFRPYSAAGEWVMGLEHSLPGDKESSQPVLDLSPCSFPCFRINVCSFVMLQHVCHMAPGQSHCYMCPGGEIGCFCGSINGVNCPVSAVGKDPLAMGVSRPL